jgi:hypothetical protein
VSGLGSREPAAASVGPAPYARPSRGAEEDEDELRQSLLAHSDAANSAVAGAARSWAGESRPPGMAARDGGQPGRPGPGQATAGHPHRCTGSQRWAVLLPSLLTMFANVSIELGFAGA